MPDPDPHWLRRILDSAPEGIAVCDARAPDFPVVYVNAAFEQMTGYTAEELLGGNLRRLQGNDRDQEGRRRIREALQRGDECRALLRNYRKGGELMWNEMHLQPLRDADGVVTHYAGYLRDAGTRLRGAERGSEGIPVWLREDRVTGLFSQPWFEELLMREWRIARRDARPLTMVLFDIDAMAVYNDTYGKAAGDALIKRVAGVIGGAFRRGSDAVGRWEAGSVAVLVVHRDGVDVGRIVEHALATVRKVADMRVHHPRSTQQKYLTVTAGLATVTPARDEEAPQRLLERVRQALAEGKHHQRGGLNQAPD